MLWRTHALFGVSSLWALAPVPPDLLVPDYGAMALGALLGSLLPDLDASDSKIKNLSIGKVKPFHYPAEFAFMAAGHRGVLHSALAVIFVVFLAFPLSYWTGNAFAVALVLGYLSHLLADACTRTGIPFLYPKRKMYWALPVRLRVVTGSQLEDIAFALATALAFLFLLTRLLPVN